MLFVSDKTWNYGHELDCPLLWLLHKSMIGLLYCMVCNGYKSVIENQILNDFR